MPRQSQAWTEEFNVQKELQEDRMHHFANIACQNRCVKSYLTNSFWTAQRACMEVCLDKHAQVGIIANLVYFNMEGRKGAEGKYL